MRNILQFLFWAFCLITFPGQLFAQEKADQIIAQDNNIQFWLSKSDAYNLILKDAKSDSVILEIPDLDCKPVAFYENQGRYFFLCAENNKATVWEIEEELERVLMLDLNSEDLKSFRLLRKMED